GVSVAHPLGPAPPDRTPRGPAAVRLPDQARADARLRGRELHARGRAADAALLPHRDGDLAPQRDAAAALRGGDPARQGRARGADQRALRDAQRLYRGGRRGGVPPRPVGAPRDLPAARAEPRAQGHRRADDLADQAASVADRRGIPPEPASPPALPRYPARAAGRDPHAEAHEYLRRA